jgi:transcriptional regulator with XRE-family HTH domain
MMDENVLGERIKSRRNDLGMSLRALAKEVDLTASFISQLERGQADPSIKSLRKIADALGVPLFYFLIDNGEAGPVVRKNARKRLQLPKSRVICELLTPSIQRKMEMFIVTVDPSRGNFAQTLSQPTEECILVLDGELSVQITDQKYTLEEGDSIYFNGSNLNAIRAVGNRESTFISAITPAVF